MYVVCCCKNEKIKTVVYIKMALIHLPHMILIVLGDDKVKCWLVRFTITKIIKCLNYPGQLGGFLLPPYPRQVLSLCRFFKKIICLYFHPECAATSVGYVTDKDGGKFRKGICNIWSGVECTCKYNENLWWLHYCCLEVQIILKCNQNRN